MFKTKFDLMELRSLGAGGQSFASANWPDLSKLKDIFPEDFNINENPDVFPHVIPMAMANRFNRNGEGIDYEGALQLKKNLKYKYIDYEHDSKEIIGGIIDVGFSSVDTDEIFEGSETEPFFINSAGLLYREANPSLVADIEESASMDSNTFGTYSASWEISFTDYKICLGSMILSECEIIDDPKEKERLSKYLKINRGLGKLPDGTLVNRLLSGIIYPLGIGIVHQPAAFVKGLYGVDASFSSESAKKIFTNLSHVKTTNVNFTRTTMDEEILKRLAKIEESLKTPEDSKSVAGASNLLAELAQVIRDGNQKYVEEKTEASEKLKASEDAKAAAEAKIAEVEAKLVAQASELAAIKEQSDAAAKQSLFNARMSELDTAYKLDDELRKVFAGQVKGLGDDEASFATYLDTVKVLMKGREKSESEEKTQTLASALLEKQKEGKLTLEDIKTTLASAEIELADLPNTTSQENSETLRDKFKKAFDGKIQIK